MLTEVCIYNISLYSLVMQIIFKLVFLRHEVESLYYVISYNLYIFLVTYFE